MRGSVHWTRGSVRSLAVGAVCVGLVLGASHLPASLDLAQGSPAVAPTRALAEPVRATRLICPGPETLGVAGLPDSLAQSVSVTAAAAPVSSLPARPAAGQGSGSLTISGLPPGGDWPPPVTRRGQAVSARVSTARSALVTGAGAIAPGTVATQWSWTRSGERRGLFTVACRPAAASSWLIAGGAEPGRREHLVLSNPGPNPVTVDLRVLGAKGPVQSPSGRGLVLGGYARKVVLLDAIAGSERSPAVQVTAQGGEVATVLTDTWLDGVVSRGGDDAMSVAAPAHEQVIAGVPFGGRAILRVAVPGDGEAVVQSRMLTPSGPRALPANGVTRVAGHRTRDIDLGSLTSGAYGVQVRADVPVVAAAMVDRRRTAAAPSDLAWSAASSPIRTLSGMALQSAEVRGLSQRLDLVATKGPASVLVGRVSNGGRVSTKQVAIGADSVSTLSLSGATSVWVTARSGLVRAAVLTSAEDVGGVFLSVTPLADLPLTTTPLRLRELAD